MRVEHLRPARVRGAVAVLGEDPSRRVGLHPLVIIFSLMAGGALLSFVGMLLAVPAAGVIKMLLLRFWPEVFAADTPSAAES